MGCPRLRLQGAWFAEAIVFPGVPGFPGGDKEGYQMRKPEKGRKGGVEGWIDERIQLALSGLSKPLERRIGSLRERIQALQARVHRLCLHVDEDQGIRKHPKREKS